MRLSVFLQVEALRAEELLSLKLPCVGCLLNLLRITSGVKGEKPVTLNALSIVSSLNKTSQAVINIG
jgi:hypothetical protein